MYSERPSDSTVTKKTTFTPIPSCFVRDQPGTCHFVVSTFDYKYTPSLTLSLHPHIHHPSRRLPTQPSLSLRILTVSEKNTLPFTFLIMGHDTAVDSTSVPGTNILYVLLHQVQIFWTMFEIRLVHFCTDNKRSLFTYCTVPSIIKTTTIQLLVVNQHVSRRVFITTLEYTVE